MEQDQRTDDDLIEELRALYPDTSEEELLHGRDAFLRYLAVVLRIHERGEDGDIGDDFGKEY